MRITPEIINELKGPEVFVFGSNEAGLHGAGAAKLAFDKFGARLNQGFGMTAACFAIPTKDWDIGVLPLEAIDFYVQRFLLFTQRFLTSKRIFLVTQIGCGLAGYTPEQIAPMFKEAIHFKNVYLPQSFIDVILKNGTDSSKETEL